LHTIAESQWSHHLLTPTGLIGPQPKGG